MPTIGLDCQLILDGTGYFIEPGSFAMARPRVRRAEHTRAAATGSAGAGERYVDLGPGKREWKFIVTAFQSIRDYAGNFVTPTGQAFRDALHTSYEKVNTTLTFTDPGGMTWSVRFDDLADILADVRSQADAELQFYCHVTLVEA